MGGGPTSGARVAEPHLRITAMVTVHAVFPGTFDPITLGHLDVLRRALTLFERVTVAVAEHHGKSPLLPLAQRIELARAACDPLERVQVVPLEGLLVEGVRALGAGAIVRGLRGAMDLEVERQMTLTNRALAPGIETVFLLPAAEHAHVSSTLVRQVARMGGDLSPFVPEPVARALGERFGGRTP